MIQLKSGDIYYGFITFTDSTGALVAPSSYTVITNKNGLDENGGSASLWATLTSLATGRYKITGTVPAYSAGDRIGIFVNATIGGIATGVAVDTIQIVSAIPGVDSGLKVDIYSISTKVVVCANSPTFYTNIGTATADTAQSGDAYSYLSTNLGAAGANITAATVNVSKWNTVNVTGMPMPTYTQPTGFLAATFPTTVSSLTQANVSGGAYPLSSASFIANAAMFTNLPAVTLAANQPNYAPAKKSDIVGGDGSSINMSGGIASANAIKIGGAIQTTGVDAVGLLSHISWFPAFITRGTGIVNSGSISLAGVQFNPAGFVNRTPYYIGSAGGSNFTIAYDPDAGMFGIYSGSGFNPPALFTAPSGYSSSQGAVQINGLHFIAGAGATGTLDLSTLVVATDTNGNQLATETTPGSIAKSVGAASNIAAGQPTGIPLLDANGNIPETPNTATMPPGFLQYYAVVVTGSGNADATYTIAGVSNGKIYYAASIAGTAWYLYYGSNSRWNLSTTIGATTGNYYKSGAGLTSPTYPTFPYIGNYAGQGSYANTTGLLKIAPITVNTTQIKGVDADAAITADVWDVSAASHNTAGTFGAILNALSTGISGIAAAVWSYVSRTLTSTGQTSVVFASPLSNTLSLTVVQGDAYDSVTNQSLVFADPGTWPTMQSTGTQLTTTEVKLSIIQKQTGALVTSSTGTVTLAGTAPHQYQIATVNLTAAQTTLLNPGTSYTYDVRASVNYPTNTEIRTLEQGNLVSVVQPITTSW